MIFLAIILIVYFAVGSVAHLMLVGNQFDWSSALTWIVVVLWPIIVAIFYGIVMLILFVAEWIGKKLRLLKS